MKRLMAILFGVAAVVALPALSSADSKPATAILAGGCFWCMEHDFKQARRRLQGGLRVRRWQPRQPDL